MSVHHCGDGTEGFFEALAIIVVLLHGSSGHKHDELDPTIYEDLATVMLSSRVNHCIELDPVRVMVLSC